MGRKTTILVRRTDSASRLRIVVERVDEQSRLYPMRLGASIPSPSGGTHVETVVPRTGPAQHGFVIDLPEDVPPGNLLDVELRADAATLAPDLLALRSVYIVELEQLP